MRASDLIDLLKEKVNASAVQILENPAMRRSNVELEARLFSYKSKSGKLRLSQGNWQNICTVMSESSRVPTKQQIISISAQGYSDRIQVITWNEDGEDKRSIKYEKKYKTPPIDQDGDYWTRHSVSVELPVKYLHNAVLDDNVTTMIINEQKNSILTTHPTSFYERNISRTRYYLTENIVLDLSSVTDPDGFQHNEIEVELLNAQQNIALIPEYVTMCRRVLCIMRGTSYLYNESVLYALSMFVNNNLPAKSSEIDNEKKMVVGNIDKAIFNQVRTLKKDDLVIGGIVGGSIMYSASYKTDGQRSLLILSPLGIWICLPPQIYNLIDPNTSFTDLLSVYDGELIPLKQRRDGSTEKYVFDIFDCLMVESRDMRHLHHRERLVAGQSFIESLPDIGKALPPNLKITYKQMKLIRNPEDFFLTIRYLLANEDSCPYHTDGIIFTPYNYKYWTETRFDRPQENLKTSVEIVKWKDVKKTTIDFRFILHEHPVDSGWEKRGRLLVSEKESANSETKEYEFAGNERYPFVQETMVDWNQLKTLEMENGTIGEYAWRNGKFVFERARTDKLHPNIGPTVAVSNWEEINSPITADAMTGENFRFMFYYHSRIKKELMKRSKGTLLDLGCGQGGVIHYWNDYEKIIATEPDEGRRLRFIERCAGIGLKVVLEGDEIPQEPGKRFVLLLSAKAQETSRILKQVKKVSMFGVSAVSLMDVGTFLWESQEILDASMETIKSCLSRGGVFLWKMMSGDRVRSIVSPFHNKYADSTDGEKTLRYGSFYLKYNIVDGDVDKEVKVFIPEGITTEGDEEGLQTEYLTNVNEMIKTYFSEGYTEEYTKIANGEEFLSEDSKKLSLLYQYGVIKKHGKTQEELRETMDEKKKKDEVRVNSTVSVKRTTTTSLHLKFGGKK